jgi:hypothetical protein
MRPGVLAATGPAMRRRGLAGNCHILDIAKNVLVFTIGVW